MDQFKTRILFYGHELSYTNSQYVRRLLFWYAGSYFTLNLFYVARFCTNHHGNVLTNQGMGAEPPAQLSHILRDGQPSPRLASR